MIRSVKEWIGRADDTPVPDRVRVRVFLASDFKCVKCGRAAYEIDHIIALINGGQNRESNLQAVCQECHRSKTSADVKLKTKAYRIHKRRAGIKKKGRGFQTNKTGKFKRKMDGTIVRR